MIIRIVTFRLEDLSEDAYLDHAVSAADAIRQWPGLRTKLWLADRRTGTYGGVYLFDSRASAAASRTTPAFAAMVGNPHFTALSIREFDTLDDLTAITGPEALGVEGTVVHGTG